MLHPYVPLGHSLSYFLSQVAASTIYTHSTHWYIQQLNKKCLCLTFLLQEIFPPLQYFLNTCHLLAPNPQEKYRSRRPRHHPLCLFALKTFESITPPYSLVGPIKGASRAPLWKFLRVQSLEPLDSSRLSCSPLPRPLEPRLQWSALRALICDFP